MAPTAWVLALIPVMFTYSGWNAAAYMAEEIRDPGTESCRARSCLGTVAVIAIYLLLNLLYLYVMPVGELAKVQGSVLDVVAEQAARRARGQHHGRGVDHQLAAEHQRVDVRGTARLLRDGARRGVLSRLPRSVHPRFKTPAVAIVAQACWASVLVLSGSADALTRYTGFAVVLFAGIAVAAVFVLRMREPDAPRPFKALGYPVAPADVRDHASCLMVVNAIYRNPGPSGAGVLVIAAGIPIYWWMTRRKSQV